MTRPPGFRTSAGPARAALVALALAVSTAGVLGSQAAAASPTSNPDRTGPQGIGRTGHEESIPVTAYRTDPSIKPSALATTGPGPTLAVGPSFTPAVVGVGRSWQGINDDGRWPTSPVSAIGPTRYVEVVQSTTGDGYAVYDRTHNTPLVQQPLFDLTACADSNCYNFQPSVIWDPTVKKFFYASEQLPPSPGEDGHVMFGFSKSSTPGDGAASWCHYQFDAGVNFPDRPQLGDSKDFVVIGDNMYDGFSEAFKGARALAFKKPTSATVTNCPSSIGGGSSKRLVGPAGNDVFAPAAVNETDPDSTGWLVARTGSLPSTSLVLFQVTRSATGKPVFHTTGTLVAVHAYDAPLPAVQKGSAAKLDTGYGGPTQAVAAVDPRHGGKDAIWTQHSIKGGKGSAVRWYEIDPVAHKTLQSGTVSYPAKWAFNGAISPDRVVNGSQRAFGGNMVLTFDTASSTTVTTAWAASKKGIAALSAPTSIVSSGAPEAGPDCTSTGRVCSWGGGSATPDPAAPVSGADGNVWAVQMVSGTGGDQFTSNGVSWNFSFKP